MYLITHYDGLPMPSGLRYPRAPASGSSDGLDISPFRSCGSNNTRRQCPPPTSPVRARPLRKGVFDEERRKEAPLGNENRRPKHKDRLLGEIRKAPLRGLGRPSKLQTPAQEKGHEKLCHRGVSPRRGTGQGSSCPTSSTHNPLPSSSSAS